MLKDKYKEGLAILVDDELSSGKTFHLEVCTSSMFPLINPHDEIIVRKAPPHNLIWGDLIVFKKHKEIYVHRLLSKKRTDSKIRLITKGDNSLVIDEPIFQEDFLGKVISIKKGSHSINLESPSWKIINSLISLLSYCQATAYGFLRKIKRLVLRFG